MEKADAERGDGMEEIQTQECVFRTEAELERKLRAYLKFCAKEPERLPNVAGFCRFCKIRRADFLALKGIYPVAFDVAQSTFTDEALNHKAPNAAATMSFLIDQIHIQGDDAPRLQIICSQDLEKDGA